jgi:ATP-dependent protease ClpP protease subunit
LPGWGEILTEWQGSISQTLPGGDLDGIRDRYIQRLHQLQGRAVIVYSSGWLAGRTSNDISVQGDDVHSMMEVCRDVDEDELDLIITSPGGAAQAAEQIVEYLRTQFGYIRCFVPMQAKSAATMIALGCDEVVVGNHSELGPIDPQITLQTPEGPRGGPAHAILRDFRRAQEQTSADINLLAAWTPILRSYVGGLVEYCTQQVNLSIDVVTGWLERHMLTHEDMGLADDEVRHAKAVEIANYFGSEEAYDRHRTHERPIRLRELEQVGVRVRRLGNDDEDLQDTVLSIYHATDITFTVNPGVVKIVENHLGRRRVKFQQQLTLNLPLQPVLAPAAPTQPVPPEVEPPPGQDVPSPPPDTPPG